MNPSVPDWVPALFDRLNAEHFGSRLSRPHFLVLPFKEDSTNGGYSNTPGFVMICMTPKTIACGPPFAADTMLHEMVHHALATLDSVDYAAHGLAFTNRANEIGRKIGVAPVAPNTVKAICWPQSMRPPGFYCPPPPTE